MQSHHLFLLLIVLATVVCLSAGVLFLIWRGFQGARVRGHRPDGGGLIRWDESIKRAQSSSARRTLQLLARRLQGRVKKSAPVMISESIIGDPVDGTAFVEGETIVRCLCGASYHQYSWQWLGEKNEGKCVNCKRAGLISTSSLLPSSDKLLNTIQRF